jgi:O-antigen/teichoic acid export membrane protein
MGLWATTWMSALVFFGLAVNGPPLLSLLYGGDRWEHAYSVLQVLCVYGFLRSTGVAPGTVFNALQEPRMNRRILQWQVIALVVCIVPGVELFGILGAAFVVTVIVFGGVACSLIICDNRLNRPKLQGLATMAVAALVGTGTTLIGREVGTQFGVGVTGLVMSVTTGTIIWAVCAGVVVRPRLRR